MQKEIAVRLFQNIKYGAPQAKGVRHQALFNATADIKNPKVKYVLDFYTYEHWEFLAKENQLEIVNQVRNEVDKDTLVSWIVRYDTDTKVKTPVYGFSTIDMRTNELILCVLDEQVEESWKLTAKPCRAIAGKKIADLLATNSELANW